VCWLRVISCVFETKMYPVCSFVFTCLFLFCFFCFSLFHSSCYVACCLFCFMLMLHAALFTFHVLFGCAAGVH
jgi:hypothetical protein